ncbi:DUF2634 domain-containing protein [Paenibacillus pinisoli]|uniref:DUF2634 domain-containing protein n=1 Tax=Paenibacillus pinisoli TaxID=1276110 RepID=A0A3A6PZY6_9BACL|nr:DUF2634 domain-containing protein [Paenibacillus pinisoli]RJX40863.1 DUF2634 domain-containing protein [Paenibacillus pinisoli]
MIPELDPALLDRPLDDHPQPSLTWQLDLDKGKITGRIYGLDAVKQAVFKALQTVRFNHDIYDFDYGHELPLLLGSNPIFAESEAKRLIEEALMTDDRIDRIDQITTEVAGEQIMIRFVVHTAFGSFEQEVSTVV